MRRGRTPYATALLPGNLHRGDEAIQQGGAPVDRFNPPPNWPPVPQGWTPPNDWRPGPELPPPPKGWPLWVNDKGKAAAGPSGHYGAMTAGKTAATLGAVALVAWWLRWIRGLPDR